MENTPVFGFFEFAYIGIPLTIIGIIYMMTIGCKLIPNRETALEEADTKNEEEATSEEATWKQMVAIGVLLAAVVFMIFEEQFGIPLHIVSVMGAMVIVLTRTMSEKKAYRSLDFSTIILVAAMMPMATALAETGAAQMIADYVLEMAGSNAGPYVITALIFGVTTVLTSVMSNTAAAALMAPIGLVIAASMGVDPKAILMTVCVGASAAYASPVGTPPNTMIYGPGNYTFLDYIKCGFPFLVIQLIVCVVIVPLIWPF
ncbi:SLC13 family permease [Oceanobacillus aidingensis]|uniref:SLC13 family permease n=1 Tax=Oceanobacillus aidingensis TaxID=645964 RepID=A0ABV9K4U1_9BACI